MAEPEGVIKYQLTHSDQPIDCAPTLIAALNVWRSILVKLGLIGQNPERYDGLGFGNMSHRNGVAGEFLITGTQTGHLECLKPNHYCLVKAINLERNTIDSQGLSQPSSEALTHASIYQNQPACQAVIHIHNPEIWQHSQPLALPQTSADIAYGTPEMAHEVKGLFKSEAFAKNQIFTMAGHEDGVVAFGESLEQAGLALIKHLARALILAQNNH